MSDESIDMHRLLLDSQSSGELSLAFHTLTDVPHSDNKDLLQKITKLDLTETGISSYTSLTHFINLEILILDKNCVTDISTVPLMSKVHTLWCNNNMIVDLPSFMDDVVVKFPSLRYLSIMRNPACSALMDVEDPDMESMKYHRLYILYRCPNLTMIDWNSVTDDERSESRTRGQYAVKRSSVKIDRSSWIDNILPKKDDSIALLEPDDVPTGAANINKRKVGKTAFKKFESKHSEGNRFIVNTQL